MLMQNQFLETQNIIFFDLNKAENVVKLYLSVLQEVLLIFKILVGVNVLLILVKSLFAKGRIF